MTGHWAVRCYPPSFRARYGLELATLVDDVGRGPRTSLDLLAGAARAWLRPSFAGADAARARLQATLATTWVAWCVGFLVAPAVNRALLDPPVRGASASVRHLLTAADVCVAVGWSAAGLGAVVIAARAVAPALRTRDWPALRPLVPALTLGAVLAVGLLTLAWVRTGSPAVLRHPSGAVIALVVIWLLGFLAFVGAVAVGPAITLARLRPPRSVLAVPVLLTAPVALALVGAVGCSTAAVATAGDAQLFASGPPVWMVLAVASGAALAAVGTSLRGLRGLRSA